MPVLDFDKYADVILYCENRTNNIEKLVSPDFEENANVIESLYSEKWDVGLIELIQSIVDWDYYKIQRINKEACQWTYGYLFYELKLFTKNNSLCSLHKVLLNKSIEPLDNHKKCFPSEFRCSILWLIIEFWTDISLKDYV